MIKRLLWNRLEGRRGLYHAAVTHLAPRGKPNSHAHDFFEFFTVWEGRGTHYRNGKAIPLHPGLLVVVCPEDGHSFASDAGQVLIFANVAVSAAWWRGFQEISGAPAAWERKGSPSGHFSLGKERHRDLRELLLRLMGAGTPDTGALVQAWLMAVEAAGGEGGGEQLRPPPWLERLRRDLSRPELMAEGISFWQKRSGRSPEHLARSCRKFYGAPLTELVNRERVARVQFLLRTGECKVTDAAFEAGFNNLAHFYRVFRRLAGRTPRRWREKTAGSAVPL